MASTNTDLKKLFSDSSLIFISQLGMFGFSFLVHTLLVRNLDPTTFGTFSLAVTILSMSSVIATFGMGNTVTRFISASTTEKASQYIIIGVLVVLFCGLVGGVSIFLGSNFLEREFNSTGLARILGLLILLVILQPLANVIVGVARGFEKTQWKIISNDILPHAVGFIILLYFVLRGDIILGAVLYYTTRPLLRVVLLLGNFVLWDNWHFKITSPSNEVVSNMLSFAWPLVFQSFANVFMRKLDILMIGWLITSSDVGLYRSIQPIANTLTLFLSSVTFIYLPIATRYFSNEKYDKLDLIYKSSTRWVAQITFPLFLFYLLFGRDLIRVLFTEEYLSAWFPLAILSIGIYSRVFVGPNGMTIRAIDRTREGLIATVSAIATNILLNLILIPRYGIVGGAVATTLSFFIYNSVELMIIYHYTGANPFHWSLVTPIIPTTIISVFLDQIIEFESPSFIVLFLIGIVISVIHFISISVMIGLRPEDKQLIKSFWDD